jgi:hypothetical protein
VQGGCKISSAEGVGLRFARPGEQMIGDEDIFDIPNYPPEWDEEQRLAAYWYAVYQTGLPSNTQGWNTVWSLILRDRDRAAQRANPLVDGDAL